MLKLNRILDFPWISRILIKCLPFINMHMGRVHDVTHCYNLEKSAFLHTNEGLPAY